MSKTTIFATALVAVLARSATARRCPQPAAHLRANGLEIVLACDLVVASPRARFALPEVKRGLLALYGGVPCAALDGMIAQVATPQAALLQVRQLQAGDSVGYNATFIAPQAMRVGVVSLGYADGYLRCWSGKGMMRHGNLPLPVVGRVSMDMISVDLTDMPAAGLGSVVGLWGEHVSLDDVATAAGTVNYELLCALALRVPVRVSALAPGADDAGG